MRNKIEIIVSSDITSYILRNINLMYKDSFFELTNYLSGNDLINFTTLNTITYQFRYMVFDKIYLIYKKNRYQKDNAYSTLGSTQL